MDIIYIEDDEIEAQIFGLGLSKRGINVLHIPNMDGAHLYQLDEPQYRQARAVFFDLFIGAVNGAELARLLRERGEPIDFLLAGEPDPGNPAAVPEQVIRGWANEGLVQWLGQVKDMPELFRSVDAVVLNPGGFSYAGYALRDCMVGIKMPVVEIHLTNHYVRGIHSVTAAAAKGIILGLGIDGYLLALDAALRLVRKSAPAS